ncbi:MAG: hypothetical protein MSH29_04445 [Tenericutes bacterium]|nr:hypothetical protein [Mycoplasmatota bacterium]
MLITFEPVVIVNFSGLTELNTYPSTAIISLLALITVSNSTFLTSLDSFNTLFVFFSK